jgi:hypothetical protein
MGAYEVLLMVAEDHCADNTILYLVKFNHLELLIVMGVDLNLCVW